LRLDYFEPTGDDSIRVGWGKKQEGSGTPKAIIDGTSEAVLGQTINLNARQSTPPDGSQFVDFGILSACAFSVSSIECSP
jgi:hypothetical protein